MDSNGWSPLHHAIDATTYSWRALEASKALLEVTPTEIMNTPTLGDRPNGNTCLHLCCDASDQSFSRPALAIDLISRKAHLEARDSLGNTPFLLAAGTGDTRMINTLISAKADFNASNLRSCGAWQKAACHSGEVQRALERVGLTKPAQLAATGRQRTSVSASRHLRALRNDRPRNRSRAGRRGEERRSSQ